MIQLNLLPDVKLEYIRAQRSRRMVFAVAVVVGGLSVFMLVALLFIGGLQKKHLSDLNKDVKNESAQLKAEPDISKILTVQNQLGSLTALHAGKPAASRLFGYLNQVTPTDSGISSLNIDFTKQQVTINGGSASLSSVNKYVDTLKYTVYAVHNTDGSTSSATTKAFSNIVLGSFGLNSGAANDSRPANFSITLSYDPVIFDIAKQVELKVPSQTTTRASLDTASDLFQAAPKPAVKGGN